jgi:hypothetical protein
VQAPVLNSHGVKNPVKKRKILMLAEEVGGSRFWKI